MFAALRTLPYRQLAAGLLAGAVAGALLVAMWTALGALLLPGYGDPFAPPLRILGAAVTERSEYNRLWRMQADSVYTAARDTRGDVFLCFRGFKVDEDFAYAAREYYLANLALYPQRAWVFPGDPVINTGQDVLTRNALPTLAADGSVISARPDDAWLRAHHISMLITVSRAHGDISRTVERLRWPTAGAP